MSPIRPCSLWMAAQSLVIFICSGISLAADRHYKGAGTEMNPMDGSWRTAGHWTENMAAPSNESTRLFFKVGTNDYTATNNVNQPPFKLTEINIDAANAQKTGKIAGQPLQFYNDPLNNNDPPLISVTGAGSFEILSRQIITNARLSIAGNGTGRVTIGGPDTGWLRGDGQLVLNTTATVRLAGNRHNTLAAPFDYSYIVTRGVLELAKDENKTALHEEDFSAGLRIGDAQGVAATVKWLANHQADDQLFVSLGGSGVMDLNGKTEKLGDINAGFGGSSTEIRLGAGTLTVGTNHLSDAVNFVTSKLTGTADSSIIKTGQKWTLDYFGDGSGFLGSVDVQRGEFGVTKSFLGLPAFPGVLGKDEEGKRCKQVTVQRGARISGDGTINCKVEGPGDIGKGLNIKPGGRAMPKGGSPGVLSALEVQFDPGSFLEIEIDESAPTDHPDYSQLHILGGDAIIADSYLQILLSSPPELDKEYMILQNDGGSSVMGTFAGKGQGDYLTAYYQDAVPYIFQIDYYGGDGNDVVLTHVATPEPASATLVLLGLTLASVRRRRS